MDAFISRKRRRLSPPHEPTTAQRSSPQDPPSPSKEEEEDSTDVKLAILASLHPERAQDDLLEILLSCEGSVDRALTVLATAQAVSPNKKRSTSTGIQSALPYASTADGSAPRPAALPLTKKGRTLHLYHPPDIAAHTPCSIIHNFLPTHLANALLDELLPETTSFTSATFKLFDNVVQSPHTACFFVPDKVALTQQMEEYLYNGSNLDDVREILPIMREVSSLVQEAVNTEIQQRIHSHYHGQRLKYQSPHLWQPNAAFVNCYDGAQQNVGYHSDQLSYLGPRAVIGSLSLGVAREFRVRRIVPPDSPSTSPTPNTHSASATAAQRLTQADIQGQLSIHLPHNSLLVMHADMQEEWKHAIAPAKHIEPHPIAGNKRINITYRWYRDEFQPKFTPRCKCGVPTVLKCVQKKRENRGRYMWTCQVGGRAETGTKVKDKAIGKEENHTTGKSGTGEGGGCGFFEWAEFTDDGDPIWKHKPAAGQRDRLASPDKTRRLV